jgi:hypothetical protein
MGTGTTSNIAIWTLEKRYYNVSSGNMIKQIKSDWYYQRIVEEIDFDNQI